MFSPPARVISSSMKFLPPTAIRGRTPRLIAWSGVGAWRHALLSRDQFDRVILSHELFTRIREFPTSAQLLLIEFKMSSKLASEIKTTLMPRLSISRDFAGSAGTADSDHEVRAFYR